MLTVEDLHDAFMELGLRVQREGKVIDLAIYGGSALMLAANFRVATQDVVGFTTQEEVIDFAASFYPEAKISARLRLGIRELWRAKDNPTQEGRHATPSYLGRGRSSP